MDIRSPVSHCLLDEKVYSADNRSLRSPGHLGAFFRWVLEAQVGFSQNFILQQLLAGAFRNDLAGR